MPNKERIEVNQVRSRNDNQIEIVISGINHLNNNDIREIMEQTFKIIKEGNCAKCPVAAEKQFKCTCYWQ